MRCELSRRELIRRATTLGVGALVLGALPVVERMAQPGADKRANLSSGIAIGASVRDRPRLARPRASGCARRVSSKDDT